MSAAPFSHRLRVRYHECDAQGIVFNANWFAYFDVTLTELWREAFGSYEAVVAQGVDVVVAEASARFRRPGRFDDWVDLSVALVELRGSDLHTAIDAHRGDELLVAGQMHHVFVDTQTLRRADPPAAVADGLRALLAPAT